MNQAPHIPIAGKGSKLRHSSVFLEVGKRRGDAVSCLLMTRNRAAPPSWYRENQWQQSLRRLFGRSGNAEPPLQDAIEFIDASMERITAYRD
jgi:hypothetical protein